MLPQGQASVSPDIKCCELEELGTLQLAKSKEGGPGPVSTRTAAWAGGSHSCSSPADNTVEFKMAKTGTSMYTQRRVCKLGDVGHKLTMLTPLRATQRVT